ncbi:hypothetical protein [Streptomyces apricus]|uniref:Uncharacterized protein n=1 Tax=Streptomyces apricus TaxID=1828112 RepID=A0A5B0AKF5_9ACTN|nr:hypothetical protein [Streptomyces apricus]KAA0930388.1 hypothetical protein FGF04_27735 [Streptomyces apricus]
MSSLRLTLCAGAAVAALTGPAPLAYAADGDVSVTSGAPVPGSDIRLRVQGCAGKSGTAASEAFVADARLSGGPGALTGGTRVRSTLDPGSYGVTVTCEGSGDEVAGTVTVVDKNDKKQHDKQRQQEQEKQKNKQDEQAQNRKQEQNQKQEPGQGSREWGAPASPVAPVHAGGGGTSRLAAAEARSEGPGTRHAVVGLVLAGVAAVAVAVRSARRARGRTD